MFAFGTINKTDVEGSEALVQARQLDSRSGKIGATHTDLYDGGENHAIPFDKIESFFKNTLK